MDILIGIVIATFIIAAVYVGYYASQTPQIEEAGLHGTHLEPLTVSIKPPQSNTDGADQDIFV
ncbi:MAG: hypothetical protein K5785_02670 [Nitrosarchaeum sp.]|nr:hypothetical protein [Nitrosarchaeum sp.]